jgi:primosomal protein N' (replication factor Y)
MKCHYCSYTIPDVPERCSRCKGYNLKLFGAGTQRIQEDLEKLIGIKAHRLDTDLIQKKSDIYRIIGNLFSDDTRIIIGTKLMTKRLGTAYDFSLAVIINPDVLLNLPDFRSAEKTYQEIRSVIDKINPDGEVFIQTKMPQNYLFKSLKNYDNTLFLQEELQRRKALNYPPYSRLLLLKFISTRDISGKISQLYNTFDGVEIIGPYRTKNKQGHNECRLLLKSSVRGTLHTTAKSLIQKFRASKDVKIKVDVDPIIF